MTVAGQPAVNYSYDADGHLTQITQGSSSVSFGYDANGRRTLLTLPNGVVVSYSYDGASQLTALNYALGGATLGNLAYNYDLAGRRTGATGSFARTGLPNPVSAAAYNADNQLTQWGAATLSYDLNGNMTSDGAHSYTWDARNHLAQMDAGATASFVYDALGRRASKTILGAQTGFLYDGVNPVQELSGTTVTANLLTGRVDEYFQRTDSSGARSFLTDALGSTLALADSTGTIQTQYTFEPFGNTTPSGAATTNSFAYTGRELNGTGLYYYRARYYDPQLGRFISEDPLGLRSGDVNFYAYVSNDPTNLIDPFGLNSIPMPWPWPLPITRPPIAIPSPIVGVIGGVIGELIFPQATAIDDARAIPKCKGDSERERNRCRQAKENCIDDCLDFLGIGDHGAAFHRCVRECMDQEGCP